jgi:hypothetical protein
VGSGDGGRGGVVARAGVIYFAGQFARFNHVTGAMITEVHRKAYNSYCY